MGRTLFPLTSCFRPLAPLGPPCPRRGLAVVTLILLTVLPPPAVEGQTDIPRVEEVAFTDGKAIYILDDIIEVTVTFSEVVAVTCAVPDFPMAGETVTLVWQESKQNFVIASGAAPSGENRAGAADVGYLENPGSNSFQSGIGVLSGWVCDAEEVEIEAESGETERLVTGYGTERADTGETCGDTDNGFGLLFNWNRLEDGEHTVVAWVDNIELGRATVRVTTVGEGAEEEFLRGAEGECVVEDFPALGQSVLLEWQQNSQNFVITDVE